eukprot:9787505-Ditylum_brightwellii.AAC.1
MPSRKKYSPVEYFPMLNTPTNSLGFGTKPAYLPVVHNSPHMHTAVVLYASACESYESQQKVVQPLRNPTYVATYIQK